MTIIQTQNGMSINPAMIIPVLIIWVIVIALSFIALKNRKLNKKTQLFLLGLVFIISGIIFAGQPNPIMPFYQIALVVNGSLILQTMIPFIAIITVLLLSIFLLGRVFCGYVCPLGAMQELISKIKIPSTLKEQRTVKILFKTSPKQSRAIRWMVAIGELILIGVYGAAFAQVLNPFTGFQPFRNPWLPIFLIPTILLAIITILSLFAYRPWCRFFCPFGAFAGEIAAKGKYKLIRNEDCNNCGLCEKICPTDEAYRDSSKHECYLCMRCVEICPKNAIVFAKKTQ